MSKPDGTTARAGSCLCKGVKLQITGDPFTFVVCHCQNCQKASGTAFLSNMFFKDKNVLITEGSDLIKRYDDSNTASGRTLGRHFCSNCGSTLFIRPSLEASNNDFVIVQASTVDDSYNWSAQFPPSVRNVCH
ncbi:hypothetical protein E1B28_002238 [Marasmius oreades]|uniref:CENP-V/GFA domain-containing protein n=1 Tax=Marasmius oreades TaxID=181124 RepID=A0A9P7RN68_9AGAR|nr:uncharacterized protein E1B28_002238 [Marasmius oreades]KAG7086273.1 hypothetical protein E1B28_002238 [Marasmius oreades]